VDTTWLTVIGLAQTTSILIGMVLFFITPPLGKKEVLELGLLLTFSLVADISGLVGGVIYRINMNLAFNLLGLLLLPLFILFYKRKIQWKNVRILLNVALAVFIVFALINIIFIQGLFSYNSYTRTFISVAMTIVSLIYFYVLIRELPTETITKLPMFWINTAVLIYSAGTFFVNLSTDYLINVVKDNLIKPWTIHNFLGIIFYSVVSIAFWLNRSAFLKKSSVPSTLRGPNA
jgi:hypothetical protein